MPFSHAGARALLSPPSCVPAQNHAVKRTVLICAWNRALPSWQGGPKTARLAPVHVVGWCRRGKRGEIAGCVASSSVSPRQGPERPGRAAPCQHARRWLAGRRVAAGARRPCCRGRLPSIMMATPPNAASAITRRLRGKLRPRPSPRRKRGQGPQWGRGDPDPAFCWIAQD